MLLKPVLGMILNLAGLRTINGLLKNSYLKTRNNSRLARDLKFYGFYGKVALILEIVRFPERKYCWWTAHGERVRTGKYDKKLFEGEALHRNKQS